jgi:hypothetical protein
VTLLRSFLLIVAVTLPAAAQPEARAPSENRIACDAGDMAACEAIGRAYRDGDGVRQNAARAASYLRRACDSGRAAACADQAAVMRDSGIDELVANSGLPDLKACILGLAASCRRLARTARPRSLLPRQVVERAAPACEAGDAFVCAMLGYLSANGLGGARNPRRAAAIYRRACDLNLGWGCFGLASAYLLGLGVKRDPVRAQALDREGCVKDPSVCRLARIRR